MSRRVARDELFKIVFEADMNETTPDTIRDNFLTRDSVILSKADITFFTKYVNGISEHQEEIIKTLKNTIVGWDFDRISSIERALLKCAVYELSYEETGFEIVANEIVELAKVYGDDKTADFVNGVLAKIINKK